MSFPVKRGGAGNAGISAIATGAIPANSLIYIMGDGTMALANATAEGKEAIGFTKEAVANGAVGKYFTTGTMVGLAGLTTGQPAYMATINGAVTPTQPATTGNVVLKIGTASSATTVTFDVGMAITR